MTIKQLKQTGQSYVILNGFKEHIDYVLTLKNVTWVGETKSNDGYSILQCYES